MHQPHRLTGLNVATMQDDAGPYGLIDDAQIVINGDKVAWVGAHDALPEIYSTLPAHDLGGRLVTPGLIDCHTHIVFGGNRAREFEMRLNGASYEQIARAGGGIVSTVAQTRALGFDALLDAALWRVDHLMAQGVTTIEVKSGYGLDVDTELKMLRVARALETHRPIRVRTSFLGAHTAPAGHDPDAYINDICLPALSLAHEQGLVDAVDGFCEGIAFNPAQIARVFDHARTLDLPVKLHAEQLSWLGGTALAAKYGALSADHVEYATHADARALAKAGTVAVLLPGAFYTLHETQKPPVDAFRAESVPMALATDWNPGSSPMGSVLLAMNMGCTLFGLTPAEALRGTTHIAACALGLTDVGQIAPGFQADLAVWQARDPAELSYRIGVNPLFQRIFGGELCVSN